MEQRAAPVEEYSPKPVCRPEVRMCVSDCRLGRLRPTYWRWRASPRIPGSPAWSIASFWTNPASTASPSKAGSSDSRPMVRLSADSSANCSKPKLAKNGSTSSSRTPYPCVKRPGTSLMNTPSSRTRSRKPASSRFRRSSGSARVRRTNASAGIRAMNATPPSTNTRQTSDAARARSLVSVSGRTGLDRPPRRN